MNEEYVHKNVYNIEIRRIDEKIENAVSRMEIRLNAMEAELSNMSWTITLAISVVGVVLAGMNIYITTLIK